MPPIIRIENLSKSYRIVHGQPRASYRTFREALTDLALAPLRRLRNGRRSGKIEEFWALKDINLEVQQGEVLGIIGRNGAGKSTLLKILSRITPPTSGRAEIRGRVGSLLEVGTGFHPELSGRENIYLNGAILGMRRREIQRKFDEIVDFSGIEKFLDTPVKRYSSGMYVRLAFAVAAHLDPEILIIDEVLAVGDAEFQKKCLGKMEDVAGHGRTILFVSHNMGAVETLCGRAALLSDGAIANYGPSASVIDDYLSSCRGQNQVPLEERRDREGTGEIRFTDIRVTLADGRQVDSVRSGSSVSVECSFSATQPVHRPIFYLGVYDSMGTQLMQMNTRITNIVVDRVEGRGRIVCTIRELPLPPGRYTLNVAVGAGERFLDRVVGAKVVDVVAGDFFGTGDMSSAAWGKFLCHHSWSCDALNVP